PFPPSHSRSSRRPPAFPHKPRPSEPSTPSAASASPAPPGQLQSRPDPPRAIPADGTAPFRFSPPCPTHHAASVLGTIYPNKLRHDGPPGAEDKDNVSTDHGSGGP